MQSSFRAFSLKKEHRTLPVYTGQVVPDSRSIKDREVWGERKIAKILRFLQFRVFFPSQGALEKSGLKICRIASFEAPDFTTFQASRSTIFLIRGSIDRNYNSICQKYSKNLVQVSIFLALEFAIKNSRQETLLARPLEDSWKIFEPPRPFSATFQNSWAKNVV